MSFSTMHYIDHIAKFNASVTDVPFNATTLSPDVDDPMSWMPYAVAGTAILAILILTLFCCCKALRDFCVSCCFVRRGNRLMTPSKAALDSRFNSNMSTSGMGTARSNNSEVKVDRPTYRSALQRNIGHGSIQSVQTYSPSKMINNTATSRNSIPSGFKTQKYSTSSFSGSRKGRPSMSQGLRPAPSKAPSAAVQVARTQKIIGNILTSDSKKG